MVYISLLRGINVGGQKPVKMAQLKALCESLGLHNVETYIQSGNVIYGCRQSAAAVNNLLTVNIAKHFGFSVPVVTRSLREWEAIIANCPFADTAEQDGAKVLISFLTNKPAAAQIKSLSEIVVPPEQVQVTGREVFLHCQNG